jgi:peptidoglycan/xylan/chitin deacetylase (PgdA/CDA1 family)
VDALLGLKIDVCTYDGLRVGVPNLLRLLDRHGVQASFFVALGPDTAGRAIVRALRPGFLAKMRRTSAVRTYGLRTILSGTLLPSRHMGRQASRLREVVGAGHELAIHGYDHRRWQDRLHRMAKPVVREEIGRAVTLYREVTGRAPRGFGAPGWQVSGASLEVLDEVGFAYASDARGLQPFFPRVGALRLRTLQLPTTFPTLDEVLGSDDPDGTGFVDRVRRDIRGRTWSVLTMHAEMEGGGFQAAGDRLLACLRQDGVTCLPLEILAEQVRRQGEEKIPAADVVPRAIAGRAGTVAMPAGFEVPYGPRTTDH